MPDPWDKIKILFTVVMIETKNILLVSWFLKHYFFFDSATTTHFKIGFKTSGFNTLVSIFVLYKL